LSSSSVSPTEDFESIVQACVKVMSEVDSSSNLFTSATEVITSSISTLYKIVIMLVTTGATGAHYRKAVGALKVLYISIVCLPTYI
jgi:SUMO ligase MMS21 Smc5/6 complex component